MPREVLQYLAPRRGGVYFDGTFGGGGHTRLLAAAAGDEGRVIAVDRDASAAQRGRATIEMSSVTILHASFSQAREVLDPLGIDRVDGLLLDLGLSSDQLADAERGFSFRCDGPLDLRFDTEQGETAAGLLARLSEEEIANLIYRYGEERYSRRIARRIVEARKKRQPIKTTDALAALVRSCVPRSKNHSIDPATRTFQALRIAVNDELQLIEQTLASADAVLKPEGIAVVISFHSLEDRIVKNAFRDSQRWRVLTKKPVVASEEETRENPRSRSAKLRAAVYCQRAGAEEESLDEDPFSERLKKKSRA